MRLNSAKLIKEMIVWRTCTATIMSELSLAQYWARWIVGSFVIALLFLASGLEPLWSEALRSPSQRNSIKLSAVMQVVASPVPLAHCHPVSAPKLPERLRDPLARRPADQDLGNVLGQRPSSIRIL